MPTGKAASVSNSRSSHLPRPAGQRSQPKRNVRRSAADFRQPVPGPPRPAAPIFLPDGARSTDTAPDPGNTTAHFQSVDPRPARGCQPPAISRSAGIGTWSHRLAALQPRPVPIDFSSYRRWLRTPCRAYLRIRPSLPWRRIRSGPGKGSPPTKSGGWPLGHSL